MSTAPPDPRVELCGQSPVTSLTFDDNTTPGQQAVLFSGLQNGKIIEWSIRTHRATTSWGGHADTVLWMSWVRERLISQGRDGAVRIWTRDKSSTVTTWVKIGEIPCAPLTFCSSALCLGQDVHYLAVPSDQTAQINIHSLSNSLLASASLSSNTETATSVSSCTHSLKPASVKNFGMCMRTRSFITKSSLLRLLVAYESGMLALWDLLKGQLLSEIRSHEETVMCMDCWVNQDSSLITCITGSVDNTLKSWCVEEDKLVPDGSVTVTNPGLNDIAIRADGRILATGGWDHMGRVFSLKKLRPLAVLTYHRESVQCVTFAPDKTLATGSKDGYIAIWDLYKDK